MGCCEGCLPAKPPPVKQQPAQGQAGAQAPVAAVPAPAGQGPRNGAAAEGAQDLKFTAGPETLFDLGYAKISAHQPRQRIKPGAPRHCDICITQREDTSSVDGIEAIIDVMESTLDLPQISRDFLLTYDLQLLPRLNLDIVSHILNCDYKEGWRAKCLQRCVGWRVIVQDSQKLDATAKLAKFFESKPPICPTYLVIDRDEVLDDSATCFTAPETLSQRLERFLLAEEGSLIDDALHHVEARIRSSMNLGANSNWDAESGMSREHTSTSVASGPSPARDVSQAAPPLASPAEAGAAKPTASLDVGFLKVSYQANELCMAAREGTQTDEALAKALQFLDDFTRLETSQNGFALTFDLRGLRVPSMNVVMKIAEWGNEPERSARWMSLNRACKVVVNPGLVFSLSKSVLGTFFYACPPSSNTYLLTDINESLANAVCFEPAPRKEEADAADAPAQLQPHEQSPERGTTTILDLGFAALVLHLLPEGQHCEFYINMRSPASTLSEGVSPLVELMDRSLDLPHIRAEFMVAFDLRLLAAPQLELVLWIIRFCAGPGWAAKCAERCLGWKVIVREGPHFQRAKAELDAFFHLHSPMCRTYLVASPEDPLGDDAVHFDRVPRKEFVPPGAPFLPPPPREDAWESDLPDTVGVGGWLRLAQSPGDLLITASDGPQRIADLDEVFAFVDAFSKHRRARNGFLTTLDLRALRRPTLDNVMRVAHWGADPARRARWLQLSHECRVVVAPGATFLLAKGALSKFFHVCPPVCRVHLLTRLGEPGPEDACFEPASGAGDAGGPPPPAPFTFSEGAKCLQPRDDPWVY